VFSTSARMLLIQLCSVKPWHSFFAQKSV